MAWVTLWGREPEPGDDRGLQYADGLFETMAVRDRAVPLVTDHLERLYRDTARLGLGGMPERDGLLRALEKGLAKSPHRDRGVAKLMVTAGAGPRGYRRPEEMEPVIRLAVAPRPPRPDEGDAPVRLRWCETPVSANPALAGMKHLARLEQVLARAEWDDDLTWEGLMCDPQGHAVCGTMSNLFLVRDEVVVTPSVDRAGVAGVMRARVLADLHEEGAEVEIRSVTREEVESADGVFLTNAVQGVVPVTELDGRRFRTTEPGIRLSVRIRRLLG